MKKRILKSNYKSIKYLATSFNQESKQKSQGSDYYIGVYEPSKNKCYLLPVSATYQMHQKVEGFSDKFAPSATDTSKTLAYYD